MNEKEITRRIEYIFYSWLITEKDMTTDQYDSLPDTEFEELKKEFLEIVGKFGRIKND